MTIEEEFFKAFGLKPYYLYYVFDLQGRKDEYCFKKEEFIDFVKKDKRYLLLKVEKRTPEITDRKLLEMICILNDLTGRLIELGSADINTLNEEILKICLFYYEVFKLPYKNEFTNKVKALFEE